MPTPARTSLAEIVSAGRSILAADGLDALTMQRVAESVGVRAPSLYKRVPSRAALVRLVAEDVVGDVARLLASAATAGRPADDLRELALALRRFAGHDPHGFALLFSPLPADAAPEPDTFARAVAPVLGVCAALAGQENALNAARTVTAWASGFLRMELAGDFQLGGSIPAAFDYGVEVLVAGLSRSRGGS